MSIIIIDFGCQYTNKIAQIVRRAGVYCEVFPQDVWYDWDDLPTDVKGIILSGGPHSVTQPGHADLPCEFWYAVDKIPVLGICYGMQLMADEEMGMVTKRNGEYGQSDLIVHKVEDLFTNVPPLSKVWNSHEDSVTAIPEGYSILASTQYCPIAAMKRDNRPWYGVQFHPEVDQSEFGEVMINNFLFPICKCEKNWAPQHRIAAMKAEIREKVGLFDKVLMAISGGVDSTVAATVIHEAIGDRLTCVFIDHGFHRENEPEELMQMLSDSELDVIHVKCREEFLEAIRGISDPELKRKIIGHKFIEKFRQIAEEHKSEFKFLGQGTIYSDVIESTRIKTHHNTALPDDLGFELIEPLRDLFKDEVRQVGKRLGLPTDLIWKQSVPGPGLALRVVGEVTKTKLRMVRKADYILREELDESGEDAKCSQWFAALLPTKVTGVKGDCRSYEYPIVLRMITTKDHMTAEVPEINFLTLKKIASRIVNEVEGVNRVLFDITDKPSGTIEYE